jgi:hypothetical protein
MLYYITKNIPLSCAKPETAGMQANQLTISVALCTYNSQQYLPQQLDSILQQSLQVTEIVVIDDASTDGTPALLQEYAKRYPGLFHLVFNKKNAGARKNFEKALTLCTGEFVFLSDHDDSWMVNKVETVVHHFNTHPEDGVVFTDGVFMDEESKDLPVSGARITLWSVVGFSLEVRAFAQTKPALLRFLLKHGRIVTGATLAIRKSFFPQILPFRLMHKMWHDAWIALVAANAGALAFIDQPLIRYRVHSKQQVGWSYMQKMERVEHGEDMVPPILRAELNGQLSNAELATLVHARRKRVRLVHRLSRFIQVDTAVAKEIKDECREAEQAFAKTKSWPARIKESIRKMFK